MIYQSWTSFDKIKRVSVTHLDGIRVEFEVIAIVRDERGQPLWLVHHDDEGREVIRPWVTISSITILEREI